MENVLLCLPERHLLLAQRVNKRFKDLIKMSPRLQRKLFFTADLLQKDDSTPSLEWNPLLEQFLTEEPEFGRLCGADALHLDAKALQKATYRSTSSRNMFLTQPAVKSMFFDKELSEKGIFMFDIAEGIIKTQKV